MLDQGLPTERSYTMSLEIDGLQESDIAPPAVSFPSPYETIQTLQPTFEFELLIPRRHSLSLRTFFPSVTLAQTSIASDVTSWSPSVSLQANTEYLFSLRPSNLVFPELGFSAPEDSSGIPLADWDSHIFVSPETNIRFTTAVPEPSAILMVVIGVAVITLCRLPSSQGA